jgi:hypothetical protein
VSNSVKAGGNFVVLDLNPATWYNLKVTAHNNAGFSVAEYEFATLTVTGGKQAASFDSEEHNLSQLLKFNSIQKISSFY